MNSGGRAEWGARRRGKCGVERYSEKLGLIERGRKEDRVKVNW